MNFTSRMAALLGELRRERNGAVADAMRFYGKAYGLNYGVSLPTLRRIAAAQTPDHDFASYLYLQDVRELRLMGLHLACPERIAITDFSLWASGIVNSEVAEEAAFALLSRIDLLGELFERWIASENPLLQYAALMASSRSGHIDPEWLVPALDVVRCHATACAQETPVTSSSLSASLSSPEVPVAVAPNVSASQTAALVLPSESCLAAPWVARLTAQGAVALLTAFGNINEENRQTVIRTVGFPGSLPAMNFVHEELAWRLNK